MIFELTPISKKVVVNPFPTLVPYKGTRIFRTVVTPRRASRDRPIGPGTLYRVYTKHNRRVGPTARRRADTLRLAAAPREPRR